MYTAAILLPEFHALGTEAPVQERAVRFASLDTIHSHTIPCDGEGNRS